jgi:hypothetical protein
VGVASGVGVGVRVGVGFATGTIFTPLFHTSFFPDLMQVYLTPLVVDVAPNFLQLCPLFTAAKAFGWTLEINTARHNPRVNLWASFIGKVSSQTGIFEDQHSSLTRPSFIYRSKEHRNEVKRLCPASAGP